MGVRKGNRQREKTEFHLPLTLLFGLISTPFFSLSNSFLFKIPSLFEITKKGSGYKSYHKNHNGNIIYSMVDCLGISYKMIYYFY